MQNKEDQEPVAAPEIVQDANSILNMFKSEFSTTTTVIYINSLGREVQFREVNVNEQKSLSKTMIENENRKDIVYDAQCALINRLCLEDDFDVYKLTEFDRIRILMEIYQNNYFQNEITYKCKECGTENSYTLDFTKIIEKFNAFDLKDVTYQLQDKNRVYNFTLNYPSVRNVSNFYKAYMKKYRNPSDKERLVLDNLGNIDYVNLFIKEMEIVNKVTKETHSADLTFMTYNQIEQLLSMFPQNILFADETGVIKHITKEFIEKINGVFSYEKCLQCGAETREGLGSVADFF